ncbi:MAG TPA: hypothetical protein VF244_07705 [Acidimicrobiales bacterium]
MPTTTPESPGFRLADHMLGGRLVQILATHRDAGLSYEAIAQRLYADHGIKTTGQTLRRWAKELELDKEAV